jgi:hypothetical protein
MGPCEDRSTAEENQGGRRTRRTAGFQGRAHRPRSRACLLKGCERVFRPVHPLARYCSERCREQARRWREWKAQHRYRQSEGGKQKRAAQSRRYRIRHRMGEKPTSRKPREGHRKKNYFIPPATARVAMRSSSGAGAHPCSDFVRIRVGRLWSGFWSGNGAGGNGSRNGEGAGLSRCRGGNPRRRSS